MVRVQDFGAVPPKSKGQAAAAGKRKRKEMEAGESSVPQVELGPPAELPAPPQIEDSPAVAASLVIVPAVGGRAEGETEEVMPPLRRRRLVKLADLPSGQSGQKEGDKKKKGAGRKGKGKAADEWESSIRLKKDASIADVDVSLQLAEKVITPVDEEFMESLGDAELTPRLVRGCMRGLTLAFEAHQRVGRLATISRSQGQEILKLTERLKTVGDELLVVKEERDLLLGQHSSLEEEKKLQEEERKILEAQLATGEEEKRRLVAEKDRLIEEGEGLKKELMVVRENSQKFLQDCHAAVEGKCRTEDMLMELRDSIKRRRIEAIKRWKRRNLNAECLELACDATLSVLRKCYEAQFPAGSDGPPFEEYAEPLLPALGLSLAEMKEMVEGERPDIPDEELDLSSEEEEEDVPPPSSPLL